MSGTGSSNDLIPIRLIIFSTMRSKYPDKVPGILLKETLDLSNKLEHVILVHFQDKYTSRIAKSNVRFIAIPALDPRTPLRFAISIFLSYFLSVPILLLLSSKYKINLIRADDPIITGIPAAIVCRLQRIKSIVCIYGNIEEVVRYKVGYNSKMNAIILPVVNLFQRMALRASHGCVVVNRSLAELARVYGSKNIFQTFPNIDLSIFQPRNRSRIMNEKLVVLFVGRLEQEKGPLNILKVAERLPDVEFLIVGYGSQYGLIVEIISKKNLSNVRMFGIVSHSEISNIYRQADILLLPSYSEGMPIVMLEAMASEVPVIVSDVGGVSEILGNCQGGFVVPAGDIDAIVSRISLFRKDRSLILSIGKGGRENVLSHFKNFIDNQIVFYKNIAEL